MNQQIKQDIWDWITGYIEVNNEFYDYKFPPCPYAKSARLKGLVDVSVYMSGNPYAFAKKQVADLITEKKFNVRIMAFPYWMRWLYPLHWALRKLNQRLIGNDFYIQYGKIVDVVDRSYFIVIVNKLSDVLAGQTLLNKTDYYKNWSTKHYQAVVTRRQEAFDKYKGNNQ